MFTENSGMVKAWVNLIRKKAYTLDGVPALSNLREMVAKALDEGENK